MYHGMVGLPRKTVMNSGNTKIEFKENQKTYIAIFCMLILIFVGIVTCDFIILTKQPIWADEYIFLRITNNLPEYSSDKEWLNDYNGYSIDLDNKLYDFAYTAKVWGHPPAANLLALPIVKIVGDFNNSIWVYRLLYVFLMLITVGLLIDVIRRRFGYAVASFALIPMLLSQHLIMAGIYVYHDAAMCLFLALTIWIIEVKPKSKWKFVAASAMVLTKIYAVAFILPLALLYYNVNKDKADMYRMFACALSLGLFLIYQWIVTGQMLYIFTEHWLLSNSWNWETFRVITLPNIWAIVFDWGLYIHFPLVIGGLIAYVKGKQQLHYSYIILYGLILVMALNGGLLGNKTYPIMYGAMFMVIPLAQKILSNTKRKELGLKYAHT